MKKKEVKKLSKSELLEILIRLKAQNNKFQKELEEKTAALEQCRMELEAALKKQEQTERDLLAAKVRVEEMSARLEERQQEGGQVEAVTEAALRINDVFAKALEAADQYIKSFREE